MSYDTRKWGGIQKGSHQSYPDPSANGRFSGVVLSPHKVMRQGVVLPALPGAL